MIADYFEAFLGIVSRRGLFCSTLRAPLRCHQIPLVKDLLFFFCKEKSLLTLYADSFNVGHRYYLLVPLVFGMQ